MSAFSKEIDKKISLVDGLSKDINDFGSFLIFEYLGLNALEISSLRRTFRKSSSKLIVHKNNILNRALKQSNVSAGFDMKGANAILLTKNDIAPFQEIVKLSKDKSCLVLKLAYFDKEVIKDQNLQLLSRLGSKEELLAKLARSLMFSIHKLAFSLKHVSKDS